MSYHVEIQQYLNALITTIKSVDVECINAVAEVLGDACKEQKRIFIMGNGGSSATASHYVCDFNKGLSVNRQQRYKMYCLSDNVPTMMAIANDMGYENIFVEQLKNFIEEGDVVIGISGSGNSPNVIKAIEYAKAMNAVTIGLSGYDGGRLKQIVKYSIHVNIDNMQITEDVHAMLDHLLMSILQSR
jgi:D-sedoheptulose 7-phosphate isomerase